MLEDYYNIYYTLFRMINYGEAKTLMQLLTEIKLNKFSKYRICVTVSVYLQLIEKYMETIPVELYHPNAY